MPVSLTSNPQHDTHSAVVPLHDDRDMHSAAFGEFHRVRQQVEQNLLKTRVVAVEPACRVARERRLKPQFLLARRMLDEADRIAHRLLQIKWPLVELDAARFDLGEVEHVVHDCQAGCRRCA